MRKLVSIILVLTLLISSMGVGFAQETSEGISRVIEGGYFGQGGLRPDDVATRAEFAVISLRLKGLKDEEIKQSDIGANFKDVNSEDWYAPYIAYAVKENLFMGDTGKGTFRPKDSITYTEMMVVLTRALGYHEELKDENLEWPTGYLKFAAEVGLDVDFSIDPKEKVKRESVAYAMEDALDTPMKEGESTLIEHLESIKNEDNENEEEDKPSEGPEEVIEYPTTPYYPTPTPPAPEKDDVSSNVDRIEFEVTVRTTTGSSIIVTTGAAINVHVGDTIKVREIAYDSDNNVLDGLTYQYAIEAGINIIDDYEYNNYFGFMRAGNASIAFSTTGDPSITQSLAINVQPAPIPANPFTLTIQDPEGNPIEAVWVNDFASGSSTFTNSDGVAYIDLDGYVAELEWLDTITIHVRIFAEGYVPLFIDVDDVFNNTSKTIVLQPAVEVSNEVELVLALADTTVSNIVIVDNITLTSSLIINRSVSIYGGVNGHFNLLTFSSDAEPIHDYVAVYIKGDIDVLLKDLGIMHESAEQSILININNGARVELDIPIAEEKIEQIDGFLSLI